MEQESFEARARRAAQAAEQGREVEAWPLVEALFEDSAREPLAARWLTLPLGEDNLDRERRVELAWKLLQRWQDDRETVLALAARAEDLADLRYLNQAAPDAGFFPVITGRLEAFVEVAETPEVALRIAKLLSTCARISGRRFDQVAERAYRLILGAEPASASAHYNWGLFLKNRGRFADSAQANARAWELNEGDDSTLWNFGISSTAAGDGETALALWRRLGCKLELNTHGLPEGRWPHVQVRLAERPVAERTDEDDSPGLEETVWVARLSPCHGRIVSALYQDLGIDIGDIVLFDGAPIVSRQWGERTVPVFPHLSTLRKGHWRVFPFAARQERSGQVAELSEVLDGEAELYVHSERFRLLCRSCWEHREQHSQHENERLTVVTGKVCIPPEVDPRAVLAALDVHDGRGVSLYVPDLVADLGLSGRAESERERFGLLLQAPVADDD